MKIKSITKIDNNSMRYDIQTTTENFFANGILVHNSMISFIKVADKFLAVTKAGRSDVALMADYFADMDNYYSFLDYCLTNDWTALFEFVTPRNRIVVDYQEENLILTAIRDNVTGEYVLNPDNLKTIGMKFRIPVVDSYKVTSDQNIENIMEEIRKAEGIEGVIIRFDDGSMYKVKSEEYIRFHNAVSRVKQEKDVVKVILNDELDDILPILSEKDRKEIRHFADNLINNIMLTSVKVVDFGLNNYSNNQKEFALSCLNENKIYSKFVLRDRNLFDGYHTEEAKEVVYKKIVETVLKESATGSRLEKVRDLFGGIKFTNIVIDFDDGEDVGYIS